MHWWFPSTRQNNKIKANIRNMCGIPLNITCFYLELLSELLLSSASSVMSCAWSRSSPGASSFELKKVSIRTFYSLACSEAISDFNHDKKTTKAKDCRQTKIPKLSLSGCAVCISVSVSWCARGQGGSCGGSVTKQCLLVEKFTLCTGQSKNGLFV